MVHATQQSAWYTIHAPEMPNQWVTECNMKTKSHKKTSQLSSYYMTGSQGGEWYQFTIDIPSDSRNMSSVFWPQLS